MYTEINQKVIGVKQFFCILLLTLVTVTSYAAVEKRYVSDQMRIQMRSGPGSNFRILKSLPSGEHLVFIEQTQNKDYTKVKSKGTEGWVLTRFLERQPVARERLIFAQKELTQVKQELSELREKTSSLSQERTSLTTEHSALVNEKNRLEKELKHITEVSSNALQLNSKNTQLTQHNQELEIQLETLSAENIRLKDSRERTFMIIGGGLIILGIILGLAIPSMRSSRKSSGWS